MNKHNTAGTTWLGRIRTALAFRHHNPVARFVSTVLAFAIAMLLIVGTGAAYADDTAPTDPTATASTDPTVTPDPAPPADPVTTPDSSTTPETTTTGGGTSTTSGTTTTTPSPKKSKTSTPTSTSTSALSVVPNLVGVATCEAGLGTIVPNVTNGFQIDGDPCDENATSLDFENGPGSTHDDLFGSKSDDAFTGGSSENQDPSTWVITGPQPTGKADIGTVWAYSATIAGDVYAYFGMTNDSTSGGTQDYSLEYNQHDPTAGGLPIRTAGDLLFHFDSNGSNTLDYVASYIYRLKSDPLYAAASCESITSSSPAAGWCTKTLPAGAWTSDASSTGQYVEGAIDISQMFGAGTCSGSFGTAFLRSAPGAYFTSQMKDYVSPLGVSTPSTCGKIIINKKDENGTLIGGATFSVSPNPIPGVPNATPYSITDNDSKDKNPADGIIEISPVDPGDSYTVTETAAPTGYLLDNALGTSTNPQTVGASETKTFNFVDHRIWKGLTATKTANTTYRAQYAWSINKEISANGTDGWTTDTTNASPLIKKVPAGSADTLFYRVTVTEGARTTSLYKVSGNISVSNPSDNVGSMDAVVTDELSGATCLVDGGASKSITVAKGATVDVPYVCSFAGTPTAGQLAGTNTGHVTWDRSTYPQVVGDLTDVGGTTRQVDPTHAYDFANAVVTEVDKTVTITDNPLTISPAWTITWTAQGVTDSRSYDHDVVVASGDCSAVFANTATITGNTSGVLGSDSAYGKVCEAANLTVSKNKTVSMTRTYLWQIHKTRTSAAQNNSGQNTDYSVTVDRAAGDGYQDSGWAMTGVITVTNPNNWEPITMTSLVDHYSGDNDQSNSCSVVHSRVAGTSIWGAVDLSLDASQVMEYQYTCTFTAKPTYTGTNTATATWVAATAFTAPDSGSANTTAQGTAGVVGTDWSLASTPVNKIITVTDNAYTGGTGTGGHTLGTLDWDNAPHTYTYSIAWTVPAGTCQTKPNTATIVETGQTSSASVLVCNPVGLSVTKTAVGNFTRTYPWTLEKFIGAAHTASSETVHIDTFSHEFLYRVKATPGTAVDSAWVVTGTIHVHNDNTDAAIPAISVTDLVDNPNIGSTGDCSYDDVQFDVASNATVDVDYTCTFATKPTSNSGGELPTYGGTNTATAYWGASSSATSPSTTVNWNSPTEVDKSLSIFDNKVNLPTGELIGTAVWNSDHTPTVVDYAKTLSVPESTSGSCAPAQTNTAWLGGTAAVQSNLKDSTDAIICVNAGTWTVSKTSDVHDGPVPVDSDITYTLTAHKTGGSNPKNVVLHDDLSALAPFVTLPTQAELTAAAPVGSTATISGNVITWTISELGATDQTLDFTVHVNADAYGVDLPNLVTSAGSSNCPNAETAASVDECNTDNDTPHYTLVKSSDPVKGSTVMPPYLGADGSIITYTLTVHNDSDVPINDTTMPDEQVTDDLTDVLDNATWLGNLTPAGQAVRSGNTLTWTLPEIPAGGTATLTYQVQVNADQWDQALTNVATPGNGGDCVVTPALVLAEAAVNPNCTTTTVTPKYALIEALKVDADNPDLKLAGAEFTLSQGENVLETGVVSGADGLVHFTTKLQPGTFQVTETKAPTGYGLPATTTHNVDITEADLDNGEVPVETTFNDPPLGAIAIAKAHQELSGGTWVPSDGTVAFNDQVKYVLTVTATGTKVFHNVTVTDYVPGYGPNAAKSQLGGFKAAIVGSPTCSAAFTTCTAAFNAATGLVTWTIGNVGNETGTVEFIVRMPNLPVISPLAAPGVSFAGLMWNQGYLSWTQVGDEGPHTQASNAVTDAASATLPPKVNPPKHPAVLPNTGGPDGWILVAGLVLLLGGGTMVAAERRKRRS